MGKASTSLGAALLCAIAAAGGQQRLRESNTDPARCAGCHEAEDSRWQRSRHAVAATNRTFAASFSQAGHHPWCTTCHQPGGVGCGSCHLHDNVLVGVDPSIRAQLAHPITADRRLGDERLCATCHQFMFPETDALTDAHPTAFTETPAQDTVAEWQQSAAAREQRTCTDCHEPHEAPGSHDRAFVRDALDVASAYDGTVARFTITANDAAHAVPTGDPFRRLVLTVCGDDPCDRPIARSVLERTFDRDARGLIERSERRIPPATTGSSASVTIALEAPAATGWQLTYAYANPMHEPALPPDEVQFVVATGTLKEDP